MYVQMGKTKENKNRSAANSVGQKKSSGRIGLGFLDNRPEAVAQRRIQTLISNHSASQPVQKKENNTGLPNNLKSGIENLSGYSMDDVKVHYNSSKPAQLNAHAYAQGTDIHIAPGQEKHLRYEAWHVVQQKQDRVKPTIQMKGSVNVNDDAGLEKETDVMGVKALQINDLSPNAMPLQQMSSGSTVIQRLTGYEVETNIPIFSKYNEAVSALTPMGANGFTESIGWFLTGGLKYGLNYGEDPEGRYSISADHNELMLIHRRLVDKLIVLGLLKEGFKHRSLANIEYITPPRAEIGPGSVGEHEKDITAVKKHLNATLAVASTRKVADVPAPGQQVLTGFPFSKLLEWVTTNGIDRTVIGTELLEMHKAINNAIYVQETSGVLPEDVPAVYSAASEAIMHTADPSKLSRLMAELMEKSKGIGKAACAADSMPVAFTTHRKAVIGYLTLLASYLLADNISVLKNFTQTSSTEKNLVPFMSKTLLHDTMAALPVAVRPTGAVDDPWPAFATNLQKEAAKFPADYWSATYEMEVDDSKSTGSVFPAGISDALTKLITGIGEVVGVVTGHTLGLDDPHAEVETASGQKAIPLEDRYFGKKYDSPLTSENMEAALSNRFKFAVGLNLAHIPEEGEKRSAALAEVEGAPTPEHQEAELVKRIRSRIAEIRKLHAVLFDVGIITEAIDPIANPWEQGLAEALTKDSPEKEAQLKAIDGEVYQGFSKLQQLKSEALNEDKSKDHDRSFAKSVERMFKELDMEFGRKLVDFNKKNLKAEGLQEEEDREQMNQRLQSIEKMRKIYLVLKQKLSAMDASTAPAERIKVMTQIRKSIKLIGERIKAAEEFHASKPKAEPVTTI